MRPLSLTLAVALSIGACALDSDDTDVSSTDEIASESRFAPPSGRLHPGPLDGQDGWSSNGCMVRGDGADGLYIECRDGAGATKPTPFVPGHHLLFVDISTSPETDSSTVGRWNLGASTGRGIQLLIGCGNLRVSAQGPTAALASWPCTPGDLPPPWFRTMCTWSTGGSTLTCGAARYPQDSVPNVVLTTPAPFQPFQQMSLRSYPGPGAVRFRTMIVMTN